MEDSPTTQLRLRREAAHEISLELGPPQHEPLTAARGILLGALIGAVTLGLLIMAAWTVWRHLV
jgi:hypothetical protein